MGGPNAFVRWATEWDKNTDQWKKMTLEDMSEVSHAQYSSADMEASIHERVDLKVPVDFSLYAE